MKISKLDAAIANLEAERAVIDLAIATLRAQRVKEQKYIHCVADPPLDSLNLPPEIVFYAKVRTDEDLETR